MTKVGEQRILSLLLALAMVVAFVGLSPAAVRAEDEVSDTDAQQEEALQDGPQVLGASLALGNSVQLKFVPLEDYLTEEAMANDVEITIYKGFLPYFYELTPAMETLFLSGMYPSFPRVNPDSDGSYRLEQGIYSYYVRGDGYYSVVKIFIVSADDLTKEAKELVIETGPVGGNGFEPNPARTTGSQPDGMNIPSSARIESQERIICLWPDEILQYYGTDDLSSHLVSLDEFATPFYANDHALHEFTSQDELMAYIEDMEGGNMHVFNLGKTPTYRYDMPLIVFTTSNIPGNASLSRAAEIVNRNGKPTVWHQAQIHPNEPAAGEGALIMIQELQGEFGDILDDINVVLIPRVNPDGSYIYGRYTAQGFDMNRDHMALKAKELEYLHNAYSMFMPEMTLDGHEFPDFFGYTSPGRMNDSDDLQTDPATSLNIDPALTSMAIDAVQSIFDNAEDAGLRSNHYGTTVNNPIGRAYYGLYGSLSILVETRGIGAGSTAFDRRVYGQVLAMKSAYLYAAENPDELIQTVANARADTVARGRYYDEDDVVVLEQKASGDATWENGVTTYRFDLYGNYTTSTNTLNLQDTIVRSRPRPTAYVIPKGESWTDKALYILQNQGAEYYELSPSLSIPLQQYYLADGSYNSGTPNSSKLEAGLYELDNVTFENGAIIVPMDQVAGNIIAMLMEPDVSDSVGYDGTLVQSGIVKPDENGDFPIYRYIGDYPRATFGLPGGRTTSGGVSSGGSGNSSGGYRAGNADPIATAADFFGGNLDTRKPVEQASAVDQVTRALTSSAAADIRVSNSSSVSGAILKAMAQAAAELGGTARLLADTEEAGQIVGRLYIKAADSTLDGDISLGIFPSSASAVAVKTHFDKYFAGSLAVVELEHKGGFGMTVEVAVKADLEALDKDALRFYLYDLSTNTYTAMETTYYIDANGYLHFYTAQGGAVIITDGPLTRK